MLAREKIRLYVDTPLGAGKAVVLTRPQAHYLFAVMRLQAGARVALFNGVDGEWSAEVVAAGKRAGELRCLGQSAAQLDPPDLWLVFAPIRKARTDFIVEKAAEMGAARILPVLTEFTNAERVKLERLQAHAVEAAEQCGGTFVPPVVAPQKLGALLDGWPAERRILFADEALAEGAPQGVRQGFTPGEAGRGGPWAILIGPEGGFSPRERARLRAMEVAHPVRLGPRILRADTAAVAALTLWQLAMGDW
ncbi:MAG: 16S rRNA (uracil(1498)-N(3))-methyltransferase [Rhodobacterales bacterium]|nr:MAG: 16S rRNA (uracil(1498)-N(3))-methyltransferase [Rhodobacterales bacterium]